ncbi:MAG: hypothetical protein R3337_00180 [Gammaproteobacteria bacterium]|nr:hypothetical protein [Gammaproteobacteria bacterium]
MTEDEEKAYIRGRNSAFSRMLQLCRDELDPDGATLASLLKERAEAVEALRNLANAFGDAEDNNWPDDARLPDIISGPITRLMQYHASFSELPED